MNIYPYAYVNAGGIIRESPHLSEKSIVKRYARIRKALTYYVNTLRF